MVIVQLLKSCVGPNLHHREGEVIEVADDFGNALLDGGYAILVGRRPVEVEAAVIEEPSRNASLEQKPIKKRKSTS